MDDALRVDFVSRLFQHKHAHTHRDWLVRRGLWQQQRPLFCLDELVRHLFSLSCFIQLTIYNTEEIPRMPRLTLRFVSRRVPLKDALLCL